MGSHIKNFRSDRHHFRKLLYKQSRFKSDCELFSHVYFSAPLIPAVAHILNKAVNLAFRPKVDFNNKCRAPPGFGLQNEARLDLCCRL